MKAEVGGRTSYGGTVRNPRPGCATIQEDVMIK